MVFEVDPSQRFLLLDKTAFFYLADTAWEMLHRLTLGESEYYLHKRAGQGFTTIQTVILAEEDGLKTPNANGDLPLHDLDLAKPNEAYFAHIDQVLAVANGLGLTLALLPTWGDKWNLLWGDGPELFSPDNALAFGRFLGQRYAHAPNLIWVLGGDRPVDNERHRAVIERMALGLHEGGSRHLKTFHPCGGTGSSQYFPDAPWLDFHMWQSGHARNSPNWENIAADVAKLPAKPTLDGEPGYEDHKAGFALESGFLDDYDCRKALYGALFSGACGHTYGCHAVWQFWQKGRKPVNHPRRDWRDALDLAGAYQMQFARKLHEWKPFLGALPDLGLLETQPRNERGEEIKPFHISAMRATNGDFALLYFPTNTTVNVRLHNLNGSLLRAHWFDPRNGEIEATEEFERTETRGFTPPGFGPDWVLVLESA